MLQEKWWKQEKTMTLMTWLILLLSFTDAFFNDIGIRNGWVEEANPFAKLLYDSYIWLFYGFKITLPLLLIFIYPKAKNKKWIKIATILCLIVYILVNFYHLFWMYLVMGV